MAILLNNTDFKELEDICEFMFNNVPANKTTAGLIKKTTKREKLANILEYSNKTGYAVYNNQTISTRSLKNFEEKLSDLKLNVSKSHDIAAFAMRAENLCKKLKQHQKNNIEKKPLNTISLFENTQYYIYERFLDSIVRKVLTFKGFTTDDKNVTSGYRLEVAIKTADEGMFEWVGEAYTDSSKDYLIIQSHNRSEKYSLPTNYMININSKAANIELCIGHMTFPNRLNRNVVTKTIILEKIDNGVAAEPDEFKLSDIETKTIIKREYRKFLNNRAMNRLSSPHKEIITSYKALKKWHDDNDEAKRDKRNENIKGKYEIRYRRSMFDTKITDDKLEIRENIEGDLIASYIHEVDEGKPQEWVGHVSYSAITRAVFISLNGPKKKSSESISTIFLILNMPSGEKDFDVLTGIISGVRDSYDGSIGMLIVAIKEPEKGEVRKEEIINGKNEKQQLIDFFDAFNLRSSIMPPVLTVAKFRDLTSCIPEGNETNTLVKQLIMD